MNYLILMANNYRLKRPTKRAQYKNSNWKQLGFKEKTRHNGMVSNKKRIMNTLRTWCPCGTILTLMLQSW